MALDDDKRVQVIAVSFDLDAQTDTAVDLEIFSPDGVVYPFRMPVEVARMVAEHLTKRLDKKEG